MKTQHSVCRNCEATVTSKYCPSCGQRSSIGKISFKETFQDFVDAVFSVNAPLIVTLKRLVLNPGKLFREFLSGRRKTYYKPVAFFVLATIIYLIIRSLIHFDPFADMAPEVNGNPILNTGIRARDFMMENINKLLFIFVFTLAIFLKLFFYKYYSLSEYLVVSFYLIGIYTLITTLNMFYIQYVDKSFQASALVVMWGYFLYAMATFLNQNRIRTLIKSFFVFVLALMFYITLAYAVSYGMVLFIV